MSSRRGAEVLSKIAGDSPEDGVRKSKKAGGAQLKKKSDPVDPRAGGRLRAAAEGRGVALISVSPIFGLRRMGAPSRRTGAH